ncbi:DUF3280 domain-containing protein [Fulvimarina sp. MAC8]|uniref:DUF3280 domain-containing protein n=1 Tax=Fulvimarina sp. MAC8 TaxID=3162874 RepID=UPI0032ECE1E5
MNSVFGLLDMVLRVPPHSFHGFRPSPFQFDRRAMRVKPMARSGGHRSGRQFFMFYSHVLEALRPRQAGIFPVVATAAVLLAAPAVAQNDGSAETTAGQSASSAEAEAASTGEAQKVAIFPFELIDSSLEGDMMGENPDETARLAKLAPMLREDFGILSGYDVIDTSSADEQVAGVNLQSCGNCGLTFAEDLGAEIAVFGTVQKVSNLILNINAYVYDVESRKQIARGSADIRSNTDQSWERGIDYLFDNVLKEQLENRP